MMYTVSYIQDNGYRCSCCRAQSREKKRFENLGEAAEFAARINFLAARSGALNELFKHRNFLPKGFWEFDEDDDYELVQIYGKRNKHLLKDTEVQRMIKDHNKKIKRELLVGFDALNDHFRRERQRQYEILKMEFEDFEYNDDFACKACPRRALVNIPKLECNGSDCCNNYHSKEK